MSALQFPCTIFKTQRRMDDYSASDMCWGDLSESQLKNEFHLVDVSTRVDPWTLNKITPFCQPQSMFYGSRGAGDKITRQECASILFDEFRHLSQPFATYGPYRHLIEKMITHMQIGNGTPFRDMSLDSALKDHVLRDNSKNSTRLLIKKALEKNIDWNNKYYSLQEKDRFKEAISEGKLPKFDRFNDSLMGWG